jgi:hypothetical protein
MAAGINNENQNATPEKQIINRSQAPPKKPAISIESWTDIITTREKL